MSEDFDVSNYPDDLRDDERIFLIVADDTEEMHVALRFACRRAEHTDGRVAVLCIIQPPEFQHFAFVGNLMIEEQQQEAEETLDRLAKVIESRSGKKPVTYIRSGRSVDVVPALIEAEKRVKVLVLGANVGGENPGPLVSHLVGKVAGKLRTPITVVPGNLTQEQIDTIT